uniref:NLR family pyrin domain containing 10 n=1 Tax=Microcebus murinus TaxID=30608 RepID=A0A8B7HNS4_MICMU|nr:NACHT, LRR and PYD domains-containing protein 10 isoform X1 [Microcebus murinus]XP_012639396.1 NACHT, LRR and PYD domains-containing protein 10 isoform X1 [Microcebus murinus]
MVLAEDPQKALLWALSDLEEDDFKTLKFHIRGMALPEGQPHLGRGELEGLSRVDLADKLILTYGAQEAVRVVLKVLKVMNLLELVDQLSLICLNDYRETYREYVRSLEGREGGVGSSYIQLLLVAKPSSESPESSACTVPEQELDSVVVKDLFGSVEKPDSGPSSVVLQGSAGTGKTTLAKKMVLDWATGTLYRDRFDYVFYVSCKEVVLLPKGQMEQLLFWCCGDSQAPVTEILRQPERLLFILDGFDELQRPFEEQLRRMSLNPKEDLLRRLIGRRILPTCSLLITTRPQALHNLKPLLKEACHVHTLGFSEEERRSYFRSYFKDEEQARKAFEVVEGNAVLYKACQVPGICWVVSSWLKRQMERGQAVSETPRNSTDIFMAYVSTFLPSDDNEGCCEPSRHRVLRSLCSLATEGIQHQRFLFEEAELRKHNLDGPSLAAFLSSNDYQEGLDIKKFYSFRHISFQEFFHAMSYLVAEDQSRLGEASRREVERLLQEKDPEGNQEMTLSVQFLLDISKKESFSNLELKFHLKISPCIMQDLKHIKEQVESLKLNRTWDLELSLHESKIKSLVNSIQMSDVSFKVEHSNERKSHSSKSFSVKTSLNNGQKEEPKCLPVGAQKEVSHGKGGGAEEPDKDAGGREMGTIALEGQKNGGMEGQEDGERPTASKTDWRAERSE